MEHFKYDVLKVREEFPVFYKNPSLIYFDSAATSHKPKRVVDTMTRFLLEEYGTVHRAVYALAAGATARYNEVRNSLKQFIGAGEEGDVVFTRGTTDGINLVAASFGKAFLKEGDEILISETEHHSNIVPWQLICEEKKAVLRVIPVDDQGELCLDLFEKMLSSKTKLVSIAHISNATGVLHPIVDIIELSHKYGAKVLIDAAQSASHIPLKVKEWDVDFLVFSGHKIYGPTGIGVLYGKKDLLNQMPPYQGGGDMVQQVSFEKTTYQEAPLKFEAGTPSIAEVMGLGSAIEFLNQWGLDKIHKHESILMESAVKHLEQIPQVSFLSHSNNKSSILTFSCKGIHSLDIGTLLDLEGIAVRTGHLCAQPTLKRFGIRSAIRISFGAYNQLEEVERFMIAFKGVLKSL